MRLPLLLEPLRHRGFRLLWTGQTISLLGTYIHVVALPFQYLALGATPVQLGTGVAIFGGVSLVLMLFGGALVDRLPRRRVILLSDLGSGVVVTAIAALGLSGQLRIEHLYLEGAFFGATSAFFYPAMSAIIPELIPADILLQGNNLRGLGRQIARLAGPVLGGFIVALAGAPVAFLVDGISFFVSFGALWSVRPQAALPPAPRNHLLREIREGLAFTFTIPWLWITIFLFALVNAAYVGALAVALPILVRDNLHADARVFGLIEGLTGAGAIVGAVLLGQLKPVRIGLAMYLACIVQGLTMIAFGVTGVIPVLLAFAAIGGAAITVFGVLWETALQRHVPGPLLGRVTSIDIFGGTLLGPVAPLVAGVVVASQGAPIVFIGAGTTIALLCLAGLAVPSIRQLRT